MEGLCNSKHPSGLLVCRLIMSLAEGFYSQFLFCLPSFANLPNIFFFRTTSQLQTYQLPEEVSSLDNLTQGNRVFNPSFVEREVDFLGKCTVSEVQGRNVQADRNATAELTGISIIHDIIHNLLCVQFLDERNNGKHSIIFETISVLE